jgi:hypothetical protein
MSREISCTAPTSPPSPLKPKPSNASIRFGLPKKAELFFFFQIERVDTFRSHLSNLIPLITTARQAENNRYYINASREKLRMKANTADGKTGYRLLPINGINIAFSAKGIQKVR